MKSICKNNECTACYACINVCPKQCISMHKDTYGNLQPKIDENKCINCNLCVKTCPNNTPPTFNMPSACYASWIEEYKTRKKCASGGIGTMISQYAISKKQAIVYGSRFNKDFQATAFGTSNIRDIELFKGSKYVQSLIGHDTFKKIKTQLDRNEYVVFIGTPCQIAGLKGFLHREYENLLTVDLICHGVCPSDYLKEEVEYLCNRYNLKDIDDIRFRGNDEYNFCLSLWSNDQLKYCKREYSDYYLSGFLLGVTMRENCYTCKYARPERISDITIGDFIGLGNKIPFEYNVSNVSSVFINTQKGKEFYFNLCREEQTIKYIERPLEERLEYGPSLRYPFPRHNLNALFKENYTKYGFVKAIRITLKKKVIISRIKDSLPAIRYAYRMAKSLVAKFRHI